MIDMLFTDCISKWERKGALQVKCVFLLCQKLRLKQGNIFFGKVNSTVFSAVYRGKTHRSTTSVIWNLGLSWLLLETIWILLLIFAIILTFQYMNSIIKNVYSLFSADCGINWAIAFFFCSAITACTH